jgi:hypothetical protein
MLKQLALILPLAIAAAAVQAGPAVNAGSDSGNRGQSVAECNHRANERDLKGQERRDFVERCAGEERSDNAYRECYARASERGLRNAERREYVESCMGNGDFRVRSVYRG